MAAPTSTRDDKSVADLVKQFSEQTSHLVRDEMRLARAEMQDTARHAGKGVGLFSAAGLIALYGVAALLAGAVAALSLVLQVWAAALIVGGALLLIAGIAALLGKRQVDQVHPTPQRTADSVRRDVEELKGGGHS